MISRAEVAKLLEVRAAGPSLLSLYLWVPLDPAELRGLPAHAGELFALAARDGPGIPAAVRVGAADARAVRGLLASRARDWLGHTVAVFACAELGLAEAIPLPCQLQERAVLATRPHVRPLLLAIQHCPAYRVAVVDRRHAWLFSIAGGQSLTQRRRPWLRGKVPAAWEHRLLATGTRTAIVAVKGSQDDVAAGGSCGAGREGGPRALA